MEGFCMKRILFFSFFLFFFCTGLYAQPPQKILDEISSRGKLLAEYDSVSWIATDVVLATQPDKTLVKRYIARKTGNEWEVVFGALNEAKDAFVIHYKYTNNLESAKKDRPPINDTDFYYKSAMAIESALADFNEINSYDRAFNVAILPHETNSYVYIYTAPIKKNIYPLGGDWRYLISSETFKILEKRQLHKAILEPEAPPPDTKTGYHIAVLDDIPEDTDVFYVLSRKPSVPELIASMKYVYKIATDGSITYLGLTKDILGDAEDKKDN